MTRRELIAYFGFKVDKKPLEELEKQLEGVKSRIEFLTGIELIKGLFELTERFTKFAEELHVAAQSAGITVEQFQRLSFAAGQSAVSQEEMSTSMARLSRQLYEARKGGAEAQKAFADVGITPEQLQSFRSGSDAMLGLADRFKAIDDPIKKQALAMQLMGRGSINMVGFLSQGSGAIKGLGAEADKLGIILSEKQVQALVDVEHAMTKLWAVIKALGATFATYLAPSVKSAIEDFQKFYAANRALVEVNIQRWVFNVTYALGFTWQAVKFLVTGLIDLAKAFHMEDKILPIVMSLVTLVTGVLFAAKAFKALEFVLGPTGKALSMFYGLLTWLKGGLALAVEGVAYLTDSMWLLGAAEAIAAAPAWLIVAAIGAIILVAEELYALFTGKKSWLDSFAEWLVSIDMVRNALQYIADLWGTVTQAVSGFFDKAGGMISALFGGSVTAVQNINAAPQLAQQPAFSAPGGGNTSSSYALSAPITINVPPGADHKVIGDKVKDGVKEHLDGVYRRTQQNLRSQEAY